MAKNPFTRVGRPPGIKPLTAAKQPLTAERQGRAPTDGLDTALPAKAFRAGTGKMPKFHEDAGFHTGGSARRR
jgi:hypothetical protein